MEDQRASRSFSRPREMIGPFIGYLPQDIELFADTVANNISRFRDGDDIYKTYATAGRGAEAVGGSAGLIDSTPYGRQEDWQDAPDGFPQGPPYTRGGLHTDFDDHIRLGGIR